MFIPHSERGVLKFRLSNIFILSLVVLLIGTVVFSVVAMNASETRTTQISGYRDSSRRMGLELKAFRERARIAYRLYLGMQEQMHLLDGVAGLDSSGPWPGSVGGGPEPAGKFSGIGVRGLEEMGTNFRSMASRAAALTAYIVSLKKEFRHIPSLWPLLGRDGVVTSPFGERPSPFTGLPVQHSGLDIASYWGAPIRVTADGVVEEVGWLGGYGLCVVVQHKYGVRTLYSHLSSARVRVGQRVRQGQFIARMGNTGLAIGFHLHYEVQIGLKPVDPEPFLQSIF